MDFSIPILVRRIKKAGVPMQILKPLFHPELEQQGTNLGNTARRLGVAIKKELGELQRDGELEEVKEWSWNPPGLDRVSVKFTMTLRRTTANMNVLVVVFRALNGQIAILPDYGNFVIDVRKGELVHARVEEALTAHYRKLEKESDKGVNPEGINQKGSSFLFVLDLDVEPKRGRLKQKERNPFAGLSDSIREGDYELDRTGRCLDALYPADLPRVILRDEVVEKVRELLKDPACRPILLVGPSQVGKTAVIQEVVWRRVHARKKKHSSKGNTWLLSPQRLISGMMYVGQWEQRLLVILQAAEKKKLVLYFDDLLGLFLAGQSGSSDLSMADMLKPHLQQGKVRVIAETTPEGLRMLEETDRGFSDLFQVIRLEEGGREETLRMLMTTVRMLERRHRGISFEPESVGTVYELQERYGRSTAFPGKAVDMLEQLAIRYRGTISRANVLALFQSSSGLDLRMLDRTQRLPRKELHAQFSGSLFGQPSAVDALVDCILLARTRLNEPGRPLANLLFVGPSGVGKTEAAKVAARLLYSHEERLVRFDMNEYVEAHAVSRLIGNAYNPDGLLTAAIRRQPFCVLLLDEIEKAHPDLFDLLLQVLGEGRLTDAVGRTVDFSNVLILMTSNLGVREASKALGFAAASGSRSQKAAHYRDAARSFFRPEFFNRLDRVVPFGSLEDETLEQIANGLVRQLLGRDGVRQRNCVLHVDKSLRKPLLAMGRNELLGARALKRALERQVSQPLSRRLAALPPDEPTLIRVSEGASEGAAVSVEVYGVRRAEQNPETLHEGSLGAEDASAISAFLETADARIGERQPGGRITLDDVQGAAAWYFSMKEILASTREHFERWLEWIEKPDLTWTFGNASHHNRKLTRYKTKPGRFLDYPEVEHSAREAAKELAYLGGEIYEGGLTEQLALDLALLQLGLRSGEMEEVRLWFGWLGAIDDLDFGCGSELNYLPGFESSVVHREDCKSGFESRANRFHCVIRGPGAVELGTILEGSSLVTNREGTLSLVASWTGGTGDGDETGKSWEHLPPLIREYRPRSVVDLRSGFQREGKPMVNDLLRWTLSQLPLELPDPEEFSEKEAVRGDS